MLLQSQDVSFESILCYFCTLMCEAMQRLLPDVQTQKHLHYVALMKFPNCVMSCLITIWGTYSICALHFKLYKKMLLFITHCDLCFSFEPPGSLSTGMSCDMQAVFQPMVSDINLHFRHVTFYTLNPHCFNPFWFGWIYQAKQNFVKFEWRVVQTFCVSK